MKVQYAVLAALLAAAPADAQEWQVSRERFPFAGSRLTITIDAQAPGTLRVIRGGPGSVRVASRAERGFTAAGLAEDDELTLTIAGEGPVDYMVAVPDNVWIDVRLPGHTFAESIAGSTRSRTFEWVPRRARDHPPVWAPSVAEDAGLYTTYARNLAPREVQLPDLSSIRSLSVRIEQGRFHVRTSRPLAIAKGDEDQLQIRTSTPPIDLVLTIPAGTRAFRLEADGQTLLVVRDGEVASVCANVTDQRLSDRRRWLTFSPREGPRPCPDPATPRPR